MWYRDKVAGERLLAAMLEELRQIDEGEALPEKLPGWADDDLHDLLDYWGFIAKGDHLPGGARVRWHLQHEELDVVVPPMDPVGYEVVRMVVERVQELIIAERGGPFRPRPEGES